MNFQNGFYVMPPEKLATIVTSLEMFSKPEQKLREEKSDWTLTHVENPDVDWYRAFYRDIGQEWLWFSRADMPAEELATIINDPKVEIRVLEVNGKTAGLLELDYRNDGDCELAFLGVTGDYLGHGAGKWLMNHAIDLAWNNPINRLWIHTCTLDHPRALPFYIKSGFKPYERQLEIADDPRISGLFPRDSAAYFPIITQTQN